MCLEHEKLVDDLTKTLISLGVTWNPRPIAKGLIDRNYRQVDTKLPRYTGAWEYYSTTMMECSICKRHTPRHRYMYCPHCGANMKGAN